MGVVNTLELIEHVLTIIALASGIIVAWLGLATWRKQIAGEAEHDLARRSLKVVYEFKETIFQVRTWGVFQEISITSEVITKSIAKFYDLYPEVEAFWGETTKKSLDEVKSMGYRLIAALELERRRQLKSKKKIEKDPILIASLDNSDEFSQELENRIENLRASIQPKLLVGKNGWKRRKGIKF
jgi:hypothetical protein